MNVSDIPTDELLADLQETHKDILICKAALKLEVTEYSQGRVRDRLRGNLTIRRKIEDELAQRISDGRAQL